MGMNVTVNGSNLGTVDKVFQQMGFSVGGKEVEKVNASKGPDMKLQRILNKFKAGKKLTSGELSYVADKSPEMYKKIVSIMQKRAQLERRLEAAQTKEEAQQIMMQEMQSIDKMCSDDDFEKEATLNQFMDACNSFTGSDAYQEMPDTNLDLAKEKMLRMADKSGQLEAEEAKKKQKKRKRLQKKQGEAQTNLLEQLYDNKQDKASWKLSFGQNAESERQEAHKQTGRTGDSRSTGVVEAGKEIDIEIAGNVSDVTETGTITADTAYSRQYLTYAASTGEAGSSVPRSASAYHSASPHASAKKTSHSGVRIDVCI